jgi:hypothetical protein
MSDNKKTHNRLWIYKLSIIQNVTKKLEFFTGFTSLSKLFSGSLQNSLSRIIFLRVFLQRFADSSKIKADFTKRHKSAFKLQLVAFSL